MCMDLWQSAFLGVIQGLTEFLPISSSGHLILAREFLSLPLENTLTFDVLLHLATLLAIIVAFWGDLQKIFIDLKTEGFSARSNQLVWAIVLGTIPAVFVGFFLGDLLENTFRKPEFVAYSLIAVSIVFFFADKFGKEKSGISVLKGFVIGVFQAFALIPGVSRSGITISGGLFSGLSRIEAIRFAFLLGIPVILGATLKTLLDSSFDFSNLFLSASPADRFSSFNLLIAFMTAFLSGFLAIHFLIRYLATHSFLPFIIYRLALAGVILVFL